MTLEYTDFVHANHLGFFVQAAKTFNCHILVRKTGRLAIQWVGKRGYTGKRVDLKAKTADRNVGSYQLAGLVCSPYVQPHAFTPERFQDAVKNWQHSAHLITVPKGNGGFDDGHPPRGCKTPYMLQTSPGHKHYGTIALVDMGLLTPRYVHGDYDLYAIIPAGQAFDPGLQETRESNMGSTMNPAGMALKDRLQLSFPNKEGPLSFRVASFINNLIESSSPDLLGALMINHGEHIHYKPDFQTVLAIMPTPSNGQSMKILSGRAEHEEFYRTA